MSISRHIKMTGFGILASSPVLKQAFDNARISTLLGVAFACIASGAMVFNGATGPFLHSCIFLFGVGILKGATTLFVPRYGRRKGESKNHLLGLIHATMGCLLALAVGIAGAVAMLPSVSANDRLVVLFTVATYASMIPTRNVTGQRGIALRTALSTLPVMMGAIVAGDFQSNIIAVAILLLIIGIKLSSTTIHNILATAMGERRLLDAATSNMGHGLFMFDAELRLNVFNDKFKKLLDLKDNQVFADDALDTMLSNFVKPHMANPLDSDTFVKHCQLVAVGERVEPQSIEMRDGRMLSVSLQPMKGGGGVATVDVITHQKRNEEEMERMARYDAVTGLPNRFHFRESLAQSIRSFRNGGDAFVLIYIDLDRFKNVNDTLGHPFGDKLLRQVATRLLDASRVGDVVARIGGDEFVVILMADRAGAECYASRIVKKISEPFGIDGQKALIGASIGMAVVGEDGTDPDMLVRFADLALYASKTSGRGTWKFFEESMAVVADRRRNMEIDIRNAIMREEFEVHYQPIIDLKDGRVNCCEALVRWRHPDNGLMSPAEFIPLAEETGQIVSIGDLVLRKACFDAQGWKAKARVAVNMSAVQFSRGNPVESIKLALRQSRLDPDRLEIEITESLFIDNIESVLAILTEVREMGVHVSIDDFGTGYSSLSYISRIRPDKVKIDQCFVRNMQKDDQTSLPIIRAVAAMAADCGIGVVVEGVETVEQMTLLRKNGADFAQGYLFSKPRPAREIELLVSTPFALARNIGFNELKEKGERNPMALTATG